MALSTLEDEQILDLLAFLTLISPSSHFSPIQMPALVTVAEVLIDQLDLCNVERTISTSDDLIQSC